MEGNEGYQKAKNFMKLLMPHNLKKVKKYRGKIPLFHDEGIEKNLNQILKENTSILKKFHHFPKNNVYIFAFSSISFFSKPFIRV